jgi:hypothetical protein
MKVFKIENVTPFFMVVNIEYKIHYEFKIIWSRITNAKMIHFETKSVNTTLLFFLYLSLFDVEKCFVDIDKNLCTRNNY